jgi:hypothetical protein
MRFLKDALRLQLIEHTIKIASYLAFAAAMQHLITT